MGKMRFGTDERIECIQDVGVTGAEGEPLCLAYKTRKVFFVACPPKQETEFDRLISDEAKKHLGEGERLQHQAYAVNRETPALARVQVLG